MHSYRFGSRFGASCSQHPIPSIAVGEAVGDTLEKVGQEPDLVVVGMTPDLSGTFDDVVGVIRTVLKPQALLATTATAVYSNDTVVEHRQGLSIWAGRFGRAESFQLPAIDDNPHAVDDLEQWADRLDADAVTASAMVLFTDPFSFPAEAWLSLVDRRWPGLAVIGGSSSAPRRPGGSRLATNAGTTAFGAIGAFIHALPPVVTVASHGAALIGPTFRVTKAERSVVYDLDGGAAKPTFDALVSTLDAKRRGSLRDGVFLGLLANGDESHKASPPRAHLSDESNASASTHRQALFEVVGFDRDTGALGLDAEVPVGAIVGFFARTAESVVTDLTERVATASVDRSACSSLLFTSTGRRNRTSFAAREAVEALFDVTGAAVGGVSCLQHFNGSGGLNTAQGTGSAIALFG